MPTPTTLLLNGHALVGTPHRMLFHIGSYGLVTQTPGAPEHGRSKMFLAPANYFWRRTAAVGANMTRSHLSRRIQKLEATVKGLWPDPYSQSFSVALGKLSLSDRALLKEAAKLQTDEHREVWARLEKAVAEATREMGVEGSIDAWDMLI